MKKLVIIALSGVFVTGCAVTSVEEEDYDNGIQTIDKENYQIPPNGIQSIDKKDYQVPPSG